MDDLIQSLTDNLKGVVYSNLLQTLSENPYFQAGAGLVGIGAGFGVLRQGTILSLNTLRKSMSVSLEINNKDPSYDWVLKWMSARDAAKKSRVMAIFSHHQLSVQTRYKQYKNGSLPAQFNLIPAPGQHLLRYKGAWIHVNRERETRARQPTSGTPWETVTLRTLFWGRQVFHELLAEARDLAMRAHEGKLVVHTSWGTEWKQFGIPRRKRPLKSVVLEKGVAEKIEEDVLSFLRRRKWYTDRGIPYRRGYLLHGPPGSGKTSFIQALAGSLSYNLSLLNLSDRELDDDKLAHLLHNVPERSFVLIEDIDAAFNKRAQSSDEGYQSSVTFSGLLNALDGVSSGEDRIIFLTTNRPKRLDPALIRPGRVDLVALIDYATPAQARKLYMRFYGHADEGDEGWQDISDKELEKMSEEVEKAMRKEIGKDKKVSMAALQGLFIQSHPREVVGRLPALFDAHRTLK